MKKSWIWRWLGCLVVAAVVSFSAQAEASAQTFADVGPNHPYQGIIQDMQTRGFINGYPDRTFKPSNKISRKHVAQLLNNTLPLKAKTNTVMRYNDVPMNHPYYEAISKVSQAGIFSGDVNGKFNPDAPLTRKQMAKVLDIAFDLNITSTAYFPDVNYDWGYLHIQALAANGITTGNNGNFNPNESVTRAHYTVFLYRALNIAQTPNSDPNATLTKGQIVNLLHRFPMLIQSTMSTHKIQGAPFSKVRTELLENVTQPLTDSLMKSFYADLCTGCDMSLFFSLEDEMDYRFEIIENSPSLVEIRTVSFDKILGTAAYLTYTFEKQGNKWKLADYYWNNLGADSFDLTKEEALRIVKNNYTKYDDPTAHVTFLNSTYEYIYDWYTDREYHRMVYRIHVKTRDTHYNVLFYPHSGLFSEEY